MLRLNADGTIPSDNPFPNSPVFTLGHRNMVGIAFDPSTRTPVLTKNGDRRDDEINVLHAGLNYGWPHAAGIESDPHYINPVLVFTPNIAPTGAAFYKGDKLPSQYRGNFFFGDYNNGVLHRVVFTQDLKSATEETALRVGQAILAVMNAPDGYLYFSLQDTIYQVVASP